MPSVRPRPLEILNLTVCGILLAMCVITGLAGRLPGWPLLAAQYALMIAGVWFIVRATWRGMDSLHPAVALALDLYPALLVPLVFDSLGPLIVAVNPAANPGRDDWLVAADRFLFGVDPTVWLQRFVRPRLTDVMYVAYCLYFVMPFAVAGYIWRRRTVGDLRRYIFIVVLSFFVSYTGYFLVPAKGPRVALANAHSVTLAVTPISKAVVDGMNFVERNKNDVFPSGHVMLTAVCLLLALQLKPRLFLLLLPIGLGVFVSTVYCRYHYVIDVIAGLLLALPMPWVGGWLYEKMRGAGAGSQPALL
jgi:membrane-associated phospholipid phosphatase